ncbi:MAG TPA: sigma-70 family RNA polymerase sigma factor [Phycisphaerales bacterium]|nr:sigma-70 family RNA polymerase sigma factor [Phycisphaerales bacterium]
MSHSTGGGKAISTGPPKLTALHEQQLISAYKAGGSDAQAAISELLHAYQRRIFAICVRMLKREDDARDATQEAILKVIEGLEGYDGRAKLSTWIIRVTMNCCLSFLRREKIRRHGELAEDEGLGFAKQPSGNVPTSGELSAGQRVEQQEQRSLVLKALETLDGQSRALLVLRDTQDLDYEELCEVFEVPLGTVKSRLFRAREALRSAIEREAGRAGSEGQSTG